MPNIQYFLGGNTPAGFYSLYHQLSDPARMRALYIVKGGPGSGKSTLMRRVERHARAAGLETEQVLCSGDPDSLDALLLPQLGAALVDGTAPQGAGTKGHFFGDKLLIKWRNRPLFGLPSPFSVSSVPPGFSLGQLLKSPTYWVAQTSGFHWPLNAFR